ncbi:hypothetical protein KSS87_015121 [Heliosperma pusillum]|nr:hypothetical protein KSS87_015121 [Heliosperma pusillum]
MLRVKTCSPLRLCNISFNPKFQNGSLKVKTDNSDHHDLLTILIDCLVSTTMGLPKLIAKLSSLKTTSTSNFDEDKTTDWPLYDSWLKKHPSALDTFQEMMCAAEGKTMAIFLDYDGTLSPIVNDPDLAFMTDKGNKLAIYQPANKYLPEIKQIQKSLVEKTSVIEGVQIEDNKFCMSVHFRNMLDQDMNKLENKVNSVLEEHPNFRLTRGKKVLEIRPPVDWDKGHALEYLLDSLGLSSSNDVLPIYIGDDTSDEDAFKRIHQKRQGYSIIVTSMPRETWAFYSLYDTSEVMLFLEHLARWKKEHEGNS